ncbi:MAG: MmcQ/YjbR family DNA-binding protein [Acidimicrobiia bacterium]
MDWDRARPDVEERLHEICVALPEVHEGPAANGRSWLIRKNHFCQVFTVDEGDTQKGIIIFRSQPPELDALVHAGHPFFKPGWGARVMAMVVDDGLDWEEVAELVTDSYCIQAPRKLAARVGGASRLDDR